MAIMAPTDDLQHDRFVELFVRNQGQLYSYILSILPSRLAAEDAFQQTSLVLWKRWKEFDAQRDFLPWSCGIARNVVKNQLRQMSRDRLRLSEETIDIISERRVELHGLLDRRREALAKCLDELPSRQSKFLQRCYDRTSKLHEVAAELGTTPNALYLKLRRLREVLFGCIERHLGEEGANG
jgi:RNA polymerase sigma-70 factor (ECF subfamily)